MMLTRGAEIFFKVARFWASRAEWNKDANRFEYRDVIGPDENHDHVDNNAFTMPLARWTLLTARRVLESAGRTACAIPRSPPNYPYPPWNWMRPNCSVGSTSPTTFISPTILTPPPWWGKLQGYFQRRDIDLPSNGAAHRIWSRPSLGIEGASPWSR